MSLKEYIKEGNEILWPYLARVLGESMDADKAYFDSILNRTGRGSEWNRDPEKVLMLLLFNVVRYQPPAELEPVPGCEYFLIMDMKNPGQSIGFENIHIIGIDEVENVRIRTGAHGPELFVVEKQPRHETKTGIMIFGSDEKDPEKKVLWTAYPGRLTRMAKPEDLKAALEKHGENGLVQDLSPFKGCAVKIIE